jgi:Uma2 family endonuclease
MATRRSNPLYTVEEYLALERASPDRHEYVDGYIYAMAGESGAHADISTNLVREVSTQLRGTPCRARSKDTKVRSGPTPRFGQTREGLFSYPDLVVICGEPEYHDEHRDVILNPAVIIEVLSESTEAFDRGEKFRRYQMWNPTLTDYLLVQQVAPVVEHFSRESDGSWSYRVYEGLDQSFVIKSINCELQLSDIYERVSFESRDAEANNTRPPST